MHGYISLAVLALVGSDEGRCDDVFWHHAHVSQSGAVVGHMDHLPHFSCFSRLFDVLVVSVDWTLGMLYKLGPEHLYL